MNARKKTKPVSLLETFVRDGIFEPQIADAIRKLHKRRARARDHEPFSEADSDLVMLLLQTVLEPARVDARKAYRDALWISLERAYYQSRGEDRATSKTAKRLGISTRTVARASKLRPMKLPPSKVTDHALKDLFEAARLAKMSIEDIIEEQKQNYLRQQMH